MWLLYSLEYTINHDENDNENLDPEKPGLRKSWSLKNLDPEKLGSRKIWTLKNLDSEKPGL